MSAFKKLAMNIVSQILDEAETPVAKRQEINDKCDAFVMDAIAFFLQKHTVEEIHKDWDEEGAKVFDKLPPESWAVFNKKAK